MWLLSHGHFSPKLCNCLSLFCPWSGAGSHCFSISTDCFPPYCTWKGLLLENHVLVWGGKGSFGHILAFVPPDRLSH